MSLCKEPASADGQTEMRANRRRSKVHRRELRLNEGEAAFARTPMVAHMGVGLATFDEFALNAIRDLALRSPQSCWRICTKGAALAVP